MFERSAVPQSALDRVAQNLADIGAIPFEEYLDAKTAAPLSCPAPSPAPALVTEPVGVNAITRLYQACQRALQSTDALKFEFIEQAASRTKQCILTITKPGGVRRSYATQSILAKKSDAKLEAAKIAIDMGALDFLAGGVGGARAPIETPSTDDAADPVSVQMTPEKCIEDIERCCLEWRAGRVTPQWAPFVDAKATHRQGCSLHIQLTQHVSRVYLSDPIFDTFVDAKGASAKSAVLEGVLDFIKHGNGQTRPSSPTPPTPSASQSPLTVTTPWTLQAFCDSLPRPFPEPLNTNDASEINAPAWLNTMIQSARGGKLSLSFFFPSDSPSGLHGCLLKLDRPGEYKASMVDARFTKRSDARAAVCLQAMSEGIGDYIRSIASALETRITPAMRSFANSLVYPALTSELSKIDTELTPLFEYNKERDAFGATLVVRLSTVPTPEQVRRCTVPSEYRNKADAKVAVICHAAAQGVVEFARFRGGSPPDGYASPYILQDHDPNASRKRKPSESVEDAEQGRPAKKRAKSKRRAGAPVRRPGSRLTPGDQPSGDQIHAVSGFDVALLQNVPTEDFAGPFQPGIGSGGGSAAARSVAAGYGAQPYVTSYPAVLDPRFAGGGREYAVRPVQGAYSGGMLRAVDVPPLELESGPSRVMPGSSSRLVRQRVERAELEPGEVVSSAESDFSESSSRNEEALGSMCDAEEKQNTRGAGNVDRENVVGGNIDMGKGKGRETSPANMSTIVSRDGGPTTAPTPTTTVTASHVRKLIDYCATHGCGTPSFHETQRQGRFQVWIVIGKERFDLPTTYRSVEEGRQRVAKQVLARLRKGSSG